MTVSSCFISGSAGSLTLNYSLCSHFELSLITSNYFWNPGVFHDMSGPNSKINMVAVPTGSPEQSAGMSV